jgi:hypothetical protein
MFNRHEGELELHFASQKGTINRIPVLENGKAVCAGTSFV